MNNYTRRIKEHLEEAVMKELNAPTYCGHEESEPSLEIKLWDHVVRLMNKREDKFTDTVFNCRYCLIKLVTMFEAIRMVVEEEERRYFEQFEMMREKAETLWELERKVIERLREDTRQEVVEEEECFFEKMEKKLGRRGW